jgi:hypothetical protein
MFNKKFYFGAVLSYINVFFNSPRAAFNVGPRDAIYISGVSRGCSFLTTELVITEFHSNKNALYDNCCRQRKLMPKSCSANMFKRVKETIIAFCHVAFVFSFFHTDKNQNVSKLFLNICCKNVRDFFYIKCN